MADSSTKDATNVPMETDASPPGEASGAKVEKTEGSLQGEVTGDVHMGDAGEVKQGRRHGKGKLTMHRVRNLCRR